MELARAESGNIKQFRKKAIRKGVPGIIPGVHHWAAQNMGLQTEFGVSILGRYYILSEFLNGNDFAKATRQHLSIENNCHWQLDVLFREDDSRVRERTLANNLSWLRRVAITLLKQHPEKDSIKGKQQQAAWNQQFLAEVLHFK